MEDLRGEIANTPSRLKAHTLGIDAKEMAPYQSEPKQMKSGAVGKSGYLKLRFKKGPHRSELVELERRVPLMVHAGSSVRYDDFNGRRNATRRSPGT